MAIFRKRSIKHFFLKKMKDLSLSKLKSSEIILLIAIIAMIYFKYSNNREPGRIPSSLDLPVGDYGPSPYENYINSQ